jgi:AMMECR1 domain-containing protein
MRRPCVLILIIALVACSSCSAPKSESLPKIEGAVSLTVFQKLHMMTLVRKAIMAYPDFDKLKNLEADPVIPDTENRPIFVSIFDKALPMIWGVGQKGDTREKLLRAAMQVMQHPNFPKHYLVDREKVAVKIDIVTRFNAVSFDRRGKGKSVEPGVHGLALQKGDHLFFQLPTDYITLGWESKKTTTKRRRKLKMLGELSEQAGLGGKGWRKANLYRFKTLSFLQEAPDYAPINLYRGRTLTRRFTMQTIQDSALKQGRHILNHIQPEGRFRFNYDPIRNEKESWLNYNATDHAGALYALSILFQYSKRVEIIDQTKAPLLWLIRHLETPLMEPEATGLSLFWNQTASATAMTLLGLTKMPPLVMEELGVARINRLAFFLSLMQQESGRFFDAYYNKLLGRRTSRNNSSLSGLAIKALCEYYRINPNIEWLRIATQSANREIQLFNKSGKADPMLVIGLAALWEFSQDEQHARACLDMAESIRKTQYSKEKRPYVDYTGSFKSSHPPRALETALRAQALTDAAKVALATGANPKKFEKSVLRATGFLLNTQINKQNSYYMTLPDETYGAMKKSLIDNTIELKTLNHGLIALCMTFDVQEGISAKKKNE